MHAIEPTPEAAARKARHLAMCHELAELGMELSRAAARHTMAEWSAQDARAEQRAAEDPAAEPPAPASKTPACKTPDRALTFARLSRTVRQAIALEARIAADAQAAAYPRPQHRRQAAPPDPRRAKIRRALNDAVALHPDQDELRVDIHERLEHALAADPDQTIPMGKLLCTLADDLEITLDVAHMSTELLDEIASHLDPPEEEEASASF